MSGKKVAVVTGSNKGIGLAIVTALCKQFEGDVVLAARDEGRGLEAVEELKKMGLDPKFQALDITNMDSIKKFKDAMAATYGGIDVLVNNAGMAFKNAAPDPFHVQAQVTNETNYFGTLNFCNVVFPLLRKGARVVNISSCCGFLNRIKGEEPKASELRAKLASPDLTEEELTGLVNSFIELTKSGKHGEHGWPNSAYDVSKVAVSALSRIQQRELNASRPQDDIVVNHVHPGYVDTDMTSHKGVLSPEQGAAAATWLALLPPNTTSPKGDYIWHDKTIVDWVNGPAPSAY